METAREQKRPQDIRPELQLPALRRRRARGRDHDAGVVEEDIEARLLGQEGLGGLLDRGQVGEVEEEIDEIALGGRV